MEYNEIQKCDKRGERGEHFNFDGETDEGQENSEGGQREFLQIFFVSLVHYIFYYSIFSYFLGICIGST